MENEALDLEAQLESNVTVTIGLFAENNTIYRNSTGVETVNKAESR
jgi:hypothetical protein